MQLTRINENDILSKMLRVKCAASSPQVCFTVKAEQKKRDAHKKERTPNRKIVKLNVNKK